MINLRIYWVTLVHMLFLLLFLILSDWLLLLLRMIFFYRIVEEEKNYARTPFLWSIGSQEANKINFLEKRRVPTMKLHHGRHSPFLHFVDFPEGYRDKWECNFSLMEDTNKELWIRLVGHKPEFTLYERVSKLNLS